jgi:hypothetical protein
MQEIKGASKYRYGGAFPYYKVMKAVIGGNVATGKNAVAVTAKAVSEAHGVRTKRPISNQRPPSASPPSSPRDSEDSDIDSGTRDTSKEPANKLSRSSPSRDLRETQKSIQERSLEFLNMGINLMAHQRAQSPPPVIAPTAYQPPPTPVRSKSVVTRATEKFQKLDLALFEYDDVKIIIRALRDAAMCEQYLSATNGYVRGIILADILNRDLNHIDFSDDQVVTA